MRRMPTSLMWSAGLLLMAVVAHAATPARKVDLSARDQKTLAASCGAGGFDAATARAGGSTGAVASVRCKPHGKEGDIPVARVTQCEKATGNWKCAPTRNALMLTMYDDSVLALVSEGVPAAEAAQTVRTVARASVPPFQNGAIDVMQGECSLRQLPERLFKGATHFKLDCTAATLDITRDCWSGKCRFFITNAKSHD